MNEEYEEIEEKELSVSKQIEDCFKAFAEEHKNSDIENVLYHTEVIALIENAIGKEEVDKLNLNVDRKITLQKKLREVCMKKIKKEDE